MMNMPNPMQVYQAMAQQRPDIANSPLGQQVWQAIQNGDQATLQQLMMNMCNSYGTTPQEVIQRSMQMAQNRKF